MNKSEQKKKEIRLRLFSSLISLGNLLNISIAYVKPKPKNIAGRIYYSPVDGKTEIKLFYEKGKFPLEANIFYPYLLAHEFGHYFCYKNKLEQSEQNANSLGYKICNSILTASEYSYIKTEMDVYFITYDIFLSGENKKIKETNLQ